MDLQIAGRLDLAEQMYRAILQSEPAHATANYCFGMLKCRLSRPAEGLTYPDGRPGSEPGGAGLLAWVPGGAALGRSHRGGAANPRARSAARPGGQGDRGFCGTAAIEVVAGIRGAGASATPRRCPPRPKRAGARRSAAATSALQTGRRGRCWLRCKPGRFAEARASSRTLIERFPDRGLAFKTLGALLAAARAVRGRCGRDENLGRAAARGRRGPRQSGTHLDQARALRGSREHPEAGAANRSASLPRRMRISRMRTRRQGRYVEAEEILRRSLSLGPDPAKPDEDLRHTSLLFLLSHNPALDGDALFAEHCRIGARLGMPRCAQPGRGTRTWPTRIAACASGSFLPTCATTRSPASSSPSSSQLDSLPRPGAARLLQQSLGRCRSHSACADTSQRWNPVSALPDRSWHEANHGRPHRHSARSVGPHLVESAARLRAQAGPHPDQLDGLSGHHGTSRHGLLPGRPAFSPARADSIGISPKSWCICRRGRTVPARPRRAADRGVCPRCVAGISRSAASTGSAKSMPPPSALWSQLLRALPDSSMLDCGHSAGELVKAYA